MVSNRSLTVAAPMSYLALLVCAAAGAGADDPVAVLALLRDQVMEQRGRILARRSQPNFSELLRLSTNDRLRLDVAVTRDREVYSWAGTGRFEDGEIDELIPQGAMGTGERCSSTRGLPGWCASTLGPTSCRPRPGAAKAIPP